MKLLQNHWYIILESAELRPGKSLKIQRLGHNLAIWRGNNGKVFATDDRCPHRGASLGGGEVKGDCITCPFHGIQFNGEGQCQEIPYLEDASPKKLLKISIISTIECVNLLPRGTI